MIIDRRPPRHPRSGPSCLLLVLVFVAGGILVYLMQNRERITDAVRPIPTPTPTQSPGNMALRARLYERDGEYTEAIETWEQVIAIEQDNVGYYIALIDLLVQNGEPARALELADQALDYAPDSDRVYEVKAAAHLKNGERISALGDPGEAGFEYARAVDAGRAATKLNPNNIRGLSYTASGLIRQDFDNIFDALLISGDAIQKMDDLILDGALTAPDPVVLYYAAEVQTNNGAYDEAFRLLEQATALKPDYLDAQIDIAYILFNVMNENLAGILRLETTLDEYHSDNPLLLDTLAQFHLIAGNYADAERYARLAVEQNPELLRAHARLGHAYFKNSNFPEAINELRVATDGYGEPTANTSFYFAVYGLALYYENTANCDQAVPIFQSALDVSLINSPGEFNAQEGLELCRQVELSQP